MKAGYVSSYGFYSDANDAHDISEENDEPSHEDVWGDEECLISSINEMVATEAAKQLCKLLSAPRLVENVEAAREGMQLLSFGRKTHGSLTIRKFPSISERLT